MQRAAITIAAYLLAASAIAQGSGSSPNQTWDDCTWEDQVLCRIYEVRRYAWTNPGVGVMVHPAPGDFPVDRFASARHVCQAIVDGFAEHAVAAHCAPIFDNPSSTGVRYYVGSVMLGQDNGTEVKSIDQAIAEIPQIAEGVRETYDLPRPE